MFVPRRAVVAQLEERHLAKVEVEGSSPFYCLQDRRSLRSDPSEESRDILGGETFSSA